MEEARGQGCHVEPRYPPSPSPLQAEALVRTLLRSAVLTPTLTTDALRHGKGCSQQSGACYSVIQRAYRITTRWCCPTACSTPARRLLPRQPMHIVLAQASTSDFGTRASLLLVRHVQVSVFSILSTVELSKARRNWPGMPCNSEDFYTFA